MESWPAPTAANTAIDPPSPRPAAAASAVATTVTRAAGSGWQAASSAGRPVRTWAGTLAPTGAGIRPPCGPRRAAAPDVPRAAESGSLTGRSRGSRAAPGQERAEVGRVGWRGYGHATAQRPWPVRRPGRRVVEAAGRVRDAALDRGRPGDPGADRDPAGRDAARRWVRRRGAGAAHRGQGLPARGRGCVRHGRGYRAWPWRTHPRPRAG